MRPVNRCVANILPSILHSSVGTYWYVSLISVWIQLGSCMVIATDSYPRRYLLRLVEIGGR